LTKPKKKPKNKAGANKRLYVRTVKVGTYEIVYEGGGGVPTELQGDWNRQAIALNAIALYEKRKQNGKGKN
jgi:hypothetical protein